ncbi:MAG TPA: hypothetical protein VGF55_31105 [Gemmataceae bacterium]
MLKTIWDAITGLFGGKGGTTQIGGPNRSIATGDNSGTVIMGDGNVIQMAPAAKADETDGHGGPERTRLSREAAQLLVHAAEGDGDIFLVLSSEGLGVQAGNFRRQVPHDERRAQASWNAAGQELLGLGLIEHQGTSEELFNLTKAGWDAYDSVPRETVQAIKKLSGES